MGVGGNCPMDAARVDDGRYRNKCQENGSCTGFKARFGADRTTSEHYKADF